MYMLGPLSLRCLAESNSKMPARQALTRKGCSWPSPQARQSSQYAVIQLCQLVPG